MKQFATIKHMTMFGRPLWQLYSDRSYDDLNEFALLKLQGGVPFNINSLDHIFATLTFRISLDPYLTNAESVKLARNAVNLHLRFITTVDTQSSWIKTATPCEPVIADAAAGLLMREDSAKRTIWTKSLRVLAEQLLSKSLVDKGIKGELYARLMCILARDYLLQEKSGAKEFCFS